MSRQGEQQDAAGRMTIWSLLRNILPYVLPYRWLVAVTLVLTLIGSLMAQVNAVVLDRAVDSINALVQTPGGFTWSSAARILVIISVILLGKEVVGALVTFCQRYYGERMRILVSRDLSLRVVERMLSFRMAFFTADGNETGKLQSRIDRGIMSLSNTVNNFFKASIDAIKQGRTVVIISHNIGQIIDADYIYVLEQGRVVQSGTPSDVYRQGGLYKDIFDASARSMNVDKIASTIDF